MVTKAQIEQLVDGMLAYPFSDFLRDRALKADIPIIRTDDFTEEYIRFYCDRCRRMHEHPLIESRTNSLGPRPSRCPHIRGVYQLLPATQVWFGAFPTPVRPSDVMDASRMGRGRLVDVSAPKRHAPNAKSRKSRGK